MKPIYRKTWFKLLTGLVILLLVFITFLPYGVQYGIERYYLQQGADEVLINDIDINLFTGKLHIYDFKALRSKEVLMQFDNAGLELEWLPLFNKRALLSTLHIDSLQTTITQQQDGRISVAGIQPGDTDSKEPNDWGVGIQAVTVSNTLLTLVTPQQKFKIAINDIALDHIESWSVDQSRIKFSGEINNAPVSLDGKFNAFSNLPLFEGSLSLKSLDLDHVSVYVKDNVQTLQGKIDLNAKFRLAQKDEQSFNFQSDTSLSLKKLSLANSTMNLNADLVSLKGNLDVSWKQNFAVSQFDYTGKISTENANGDYQNNYLYHNDRFEWKGALNHASQNAPYKLTGTVSANGIKVDDRASTVELVKAEQLTISKLSASSDLSLQASDWSVDNFSLLLPTNSVDQTPMFQAKNLTVNQTDYTKSQLVLDNITILQALIDIDRQKDGRITQLALLEKKPTESKKASDSSSSSPEQPVEPLGIKITQLSLSPNSIIRFNDASVEPKFNTEIEIQQATLKQLDSSQPTNQSPLAIKAKLDKYSSVLIDGYIKPFTKPFDLALQASLKGINLPTLSSYSANTIGYNMVSGQLISDSKLKIENGKLDGSNKLAINNLEIKPANTGKADKLNAELSMPLDSALSLLRNNDNDIKLNLPVTGNINNPDFDITSVINKALGNALKESSLAYLTFALQPYGSLIAIASFANNAANQVNLNPIEFSPGSSALNQTARDYVTKLSTVLTDRPQLQLKLCGYTTQKDKTALSTPENKKTDNTSTIKTDLKTIPVSDKDMQALAINRAEAIKDSLINTYKTEASRLFICKPEMDNKPDSKPRVEITL